MKCSHNNVMHLKHADNSSATERHAAGGEISTFYKVRKCVKCFSWLCTLRNGDVIKYYVIGQVAAVFETSGFLIPAEPAEPMSVLARYY